MRVEETEGESVNPSHKVFLGIFVAIGFKCLQGLAVLHAVPYSGGIPIAESTNIKLQFTHRGV